MTVMDYVQTGILVLAAGGALAGAVNRWAVANHRDRLAMLTGAAANAAGRIREALSNLPVGSDPAAVKSAMIQTATAAIVAEFDKTGPKISATPAKIEGMIVGQLGNLPVASVAAAATAMPALLDAVNGLRAEVQQQGRSAA